MDKITYLAELAEGLARWVPERERQDILRYYAEYFDEAGLGKEAEVVAELGDPWALSCRLAVEGGYVSQEAANSWTPPRRKTKAWPFVAAGAAVVMLMTVVGVASLASNVGRAVGGFVRAMAVDETTATDYANNIMEFGVASIEDVPNVQFFEYESGFWTMEDGNLDAFSSIDCDVSMCNIVVCDGNDFSLFIEPGGWDVNWEVKDDGTLKIRDTGHLGPNAVTADVAGGWQAKVTICVPQTTALDKINVKTDMGDVYIAAVTAGKVTAETQAGDVECSEVYEVQKLNLKASAGDIMLGFGQLWSGAELDLEADAGDVDVNLGCWERECAYELEADAGDVIVNDTYFGQKAKQKGDLPYKLDVKSDAGDILVNFYIGQKG